MNFTFQIMTILAISSLGTKKSQLLNSDEEKTVSREKSHSMGTFLAFFARN